MISVPNIRVIKLLEFICLKYPGANFRTDCLLSILTKEPAEEALESRHAATTKINDVTTKGNFVFSNLVDGSYIMLSPGATMYERALQEEAIYVFAQESCWPGYV